MSSLGSFAPPGVHASNGSAARVSEQVGAVTVSLADVQPEAIGWLWPGRLPVGKLVVLDGDPGVGKSTLSVTLAAHLTTGRRWPDGAYCPTGDVLILSAEDGLADTVRPRLDAAGGDPTRVHALTDVRFAGEDGKPKTRPPTLADILQIEAAIRRYSARLAVVDVLMAYLPGKVDSHRDQDVRGVLSALKDVAERTSCTVLLLRHLNKASGGSPLYRGGGSIGIIGAVRAAMLAAPDPDDESRQVLVVTKSNLAAKPQGLAYRLVDAGACARVAWDGVTAHTAEQLLAGREDDDGERTERDEAVEWLIAYLADRGGEVGAAEAIRDAARVGIAKTTLTRARQRAGVQSAKGGMASGWLWRLGPAPRRIQPTPEESEESSPQRVGSSVPSADSSPPDVLRTADTPASLRRVKGWNCATCRRPIEDGVEFNRRGYHDACLPVGAA